MGGREGMRGVGKCTIECSEGGRKGRRGGGGGGGGVVYRARPYSKCEA